MKNKKGFTLVELVVSITITIIIIIPLIIFIADVSSEIKYSNRKTVYISKIYSIEDKILELKGRYLSGVLLIDNNDLIGSDVLLLRTKNGESEKEGYIFAQINFDTLLIDGSGNIDNVGKKNFAYRKISGTELTQLESDPNKVYNYKFHLDKIFSGFVLKNFQVNTYNNNEIFELTFSNYINYEKYSGVKKYSEIPESEIQNYILNF